jgi:dTDP-4-amino-4,6-dideoxygalactose transaminase
VGAEVELVDVNPATWCMRLPPKLEGRTRSLVVHQFGFPAPVLEGDISDAACAVGVPQAMNGACACLSFHPRKIVTTGEGGAIVGDDEGLRDNLRALRSHGMAFRPIEPQPSSGGPLTAGDVLTPALNYRMPEASAAIGRVQLRRLKEFFEERQAIVARYREKLKGTALKIQADAPMRAWQTFAVVLPEGADRDRLRARLAEDGIETQVASYALHRMTAWRDDPAKFPVADALHDRALALPLWNGLPLTQVDLVARLLLARLE